MAYTLNTTKAYHVKELNTLGWELTICNALYPEDTVLRNVLSCDDSFGHLLYDFLDRWIPMRDVVHVVEIGGGHGYLMRDFLGRNGSLKACMIDISPVLLEKQMENLANQPVIFREEDFLETSVDALGGFDLAILNENLGDFPTLVNLDQAVLGLSDDTKDENVKTVERFINEYHIVLPGIGLCNVNIGALLAIEKLCMSGIPFIYAGEHSCEASVPQMLKRFIKIESSENPERISLMGHDEYSIKFSHLERVACAFGYESLRGPFADFISLEVTPEVQAVLASRGLYSDKEEILCHFIEDLYKYEYLVLLRK